MKIQVQITDPAHPHANEYGVMDTEITVMQGTMFEVTLENCPHLNSGCFAMKKQCRRTTTENTEEKPS